MGPLVVVVLLPLLEHGLGLLHVRKDVRLRAFLVKPSVEAFDERVLAGLTRLDEVKADVMSLRLLLHRSARELESVIDEDAFGQTVLS